MLCTSKHVLHILALFHCSIDRFFFSRPFTSVPLLTPQASFCLASISRRSTEGHSTHYHSASLLQLSLWGHFFLFFLLLTIQFWSILSHFFCVNTLVHLTPVQFDFLPGIKAAEACCVMKTDCFCSWFSSLACNFYLKQTGWAQMYWRVRTRSVYCVM